MQADLIESNVRALYGEIWFQEAKQSKVGIEFSNKFISLENW
jgi:hypothetical protein